MKRFLVEAEVNRIITKVIRAKNATQAKEKMKQQLRSKPLKLRGKDIVVFYTESE